MEDDEPYLVALQRDLIERDKRIAELEAALREIDRIGSSKRRMICRTRSMAMSLKRLVATDKDKIAAAEQKISDLRELLRDVYDVAKNGKPISGGLLSRIRLHAAFGR